MIRLLGILLSMSIVLVFGMIGTVTVAQIHKWDSWGVLGLLLLFTVPLSWLIALAITSRD